MGTIKKGILGAFSGKVGNVVGASWKGIAYMRSLPASVKNPRSLKQRTQRSKFSLALEVIQPLLSVIKQGWKLYANKQSAFNAAMSYTVFNVIQGEYPDYNVDYSKIIISRGNLTAAADYAVVASPTGATINWGDNSGQGAAQPTDVVIVAALNPAKGEIATPVADATRADGTIDIVYPGHWENYKTHVYLGFISDDGKEVANSVYLGEVNKP